MFDSTGHAMSINHIFIIIIIIIITIIIITIKGRISKGLKDRKGRLKGSKGRLVKL